MDLDFWKETYEEDLRKLASPDWQRFVWFRQGKYDGPGRRAVSDPIEFIVQFWDGLLLEDFVPALREAGYNQMSREFADLTEALRPYWIRVAEKGYPEFTPAMLDEPRWKRVVATAARITARIDRYGWENKRKG